MEGREKKSVGAFAIKSVSLATNLRLAEKKLLDIEYAEQQQQQQSLSNL
jgi:hypothetical protein